MAEPLTLFHAIVIGLVEGLTEFLPVSSTAHNDIIPVLLGWGDPGTAFSAFVQLGPIVAIIAYFRRDLRKYIAGILRTKTPMAIPKGDQDARIGWYAILGTLPISLLGVVFEKKIDNEFRTITVIAFGFIFFALVLFAAERIAKKTRTLETLRSNDAVTIGLAQCLALIPGTSRSGITLTAGLFRGFTREDSLRFSFLLSIPAITAAGLYKLKDVVRDPHVKELIGPYLAGTLVAGIVGYLVIHWLLGYVRKHSTDIFIVYRIIVGIALLLLLRNGALPNKPKKSEEASAAQSLRPRRAFSSAGNGEIANAVSPVRNIRSR